MRIILSIDDGCLSDLRVAELAEKYDIKLVFYWPVEWHSLAYEKGYTPLSQNDAKAISKKHEIGSHTITHRHLTQIPMHEAKYEIKESKRMLEDMFGVRIKKFAPPRGYTNPLLTKFTQRFYEKQRLTKGDGLVHIHPDSGANSNTPWQEAAKKGFVELWCHSWELDKYDLWEELEGFLSEHSSR